MCSDKQGKFLIKKHIGYKVFNETSNGLYGFLKGLYKRYPIEKRLNKKDYKSGDITMFKKLSPLDV